MKRSQGEVAPDFCIPHRCLAASPKVSFPGLIGAKTKEREHYFAFKTLRLNYNCLKSLLFICSGFAVTSVYVN